MDDTPPATARRDFADAARAYADLVARVPDGAWARPGLGVWTVRELVGHTTRAFSTVRIAEGPLDPAVPRLPDAVAYLHTGRAAGLTNSDVVARAGRQAAGTLGADPAAAVREAAARALALVDASPDDAVVVGRIAAMRLADYLPTRTFELVVHGLDLCAAAGLPLQAPPGPLAACVRLVTRVALDQGLGPDLLLALTGRRPLPEGTCVL